MKTTPLLTLAMLATLAGPAAAEPSPVVRGNTAFALDLYGKLSTAEGNLFLSPYSISMALAMTSGGARGQTLAQMEKTLRFPGQDQLHPAMAALRKQINAPGERGYQLNTANALWGRKGHPFATDYLALVTRYYGAGFQRVDFASNPEKARQTINRWVEKETKDRIKDLLKKGMIDSDTTLVLTNAIYFKGDWATQFKKDRTRKGLFSTPKEKVMVPFMNQTEKFGYRETPALQILEMPYKGKDLAMVVLLPRRADGLAALEKDLSPAKLETWMGKLPGRKVRVSFPRFKMTREFSLKKELSELGMPLAFSASADFSGMSEEDRSLYISAVVHKAFVAVDEKGTEAAAATGVAIKPTSAEILPNFRADHPFLFLIRDRRSDSILFLGRVVHPDTQAH
jgi:serine protease inhibitor